MKTRRILSLLMTLALLTGLVTLPVMPSAMAAGGWSPVPVWGPNLSSESISGGDFVTGQVGIRRVSTTACTLEMETGGIIKLTPTTTVNKDLRIIVPATGYGGSTDTNTANAFKPTLGAKYKVEFEAYLSVGATGNVRVQGNQGKNGTVSEETVLGDNPSSPTTVTYEWTQGSPIANSGDLWIGTVGLPVDESLYIKNIVIYEYEPDEDEIVTNAIAKIGAAFASAEVAQATVNTEADAKTHVDGLIAALNLGVDTAVVSPIAASPFQAAVAGSAGSSAADGFYKFTVNVDKSGSTGAVDTATLTLVIKGTAYVAPPSGPGSWTEVWKPDLTGKAVESSDRVSGEVGIRIPSTTNTVLAIVDNSTFSIAKNSATSAEGLVNILVGSANGADSNTAWAAATGFNPTPGKQYKVTFSASVASGTGSVGVRGNHRTNGAFNDTPLTTTPTTVTFEWTQAVPDASGTSNSTSGNLQLNTGTTPQNVAVIIGDIKIEEWVPAPPADTSIRLEADFDKAPYTPGETIISSSTGSGVKGTGGWYSHNNGDHAVGAETSASNFNASLKLIDGAGAMLGSQVLEMNLMGGTNRVVNIDFDTPIEKDTGIYAMVFDYAITAASAGNVRFGFSDTVWNTNGASGRQTTGINVVNNVALRISPSKLETGANDLIEDGFSPGPWNRVYAVINTDNDTIKWYTTSTGSAPAFKDATDGPGVADALKWGADGKINSICFVQGSGTAIVMNIANIKIFEYDPPLREIVLYDMQDDARLDAFHNAGSTPHPSGYIVRSSGTSTVDLTSDPKTVTVTGRSGTSQGIRFELGGIVTKPDHSYRFDATGILPAGEQGRLRLESPSTVLDAQPLNAAGEFSVSYTATAAWVNTNAATTISIGNTTSGTVDITYTGIKVTAICPLDCADCGGVVLPEEDTFTHINLAPGRNVTEIGFAWFTPKGYTPKTPRIQVVTKAAWDAVFGDWATAAGVRTISATSGVGTSLFDTNKVTVNNLAKSTEYVYRVGDGTDWSYDYTFKTQNPDGVYEVIIVADPQVSSSSSAWKRAAAAMTAEAPDAAFILSAGDQTSDGNNPAQVEGYVSPPQLRNYPVAATFGNHDFQMTDAYEKIAYLDLIYQWPANAIEMKESNHAAGQNYYFSYGNTLYIVLNSNVQDASKHEAFMETAIKSHPAATWRIALFHHDIYGGGDHAGSGYGDSAKMQPTWSPFLDKYNIDIVFNGHDHIYARSKFMKNDEEHRDQMSSILDVFDKDARPANPGAFILPDGIQYLGLSAAGDKSYELEMQEWIAFSPGNLNTPEYTIMTVDGDNIIIETYRSDTGVCYDKITLRKKALREDLASVITGAEALAKNDILTSGWNAFQTELTRAKAARDNAAATADQIHNAYVALYAKYFDLKVPIDKTELGLLNNEVKAKLAISSEGRYEGTYPVGSKAILKGFLDTAIEIYETRLPTVAAHDEALAELKAAYAAFLASVSDIPIPWVILHEIAATGESKVDLIGWMDEKKVYDWGDGIVVYDSNYTKTSVAAASASLSPNIAGNSGGHRTEPFFGPANALGGRGKSEGHITKTFIGEYIRYELNVTQAGSYEVKLGAANSTASAQKILLRDTNQNILAAFTVPASTPLPAGGWEAAQLIEADQAVYLPKGKYVIELFFVNTGARVSSETSYVAGADIDILTFTPGGDAVPFVAPDEPDRFYLPLPAPMAAGAAARQRGWGAGSQTDEWGGKGGVTVAAFRAATHLVLELATDQRPSSSMQFVIQTDGGSWNQTDISSAGLIGTSTVATTWDDATNSLIFDLSVMTGYAGLQNMDSRGWIVVSYYSRGYSELNIMRAYLKLDTDIYEPESGISEGNPLGITLADLGGQLYAAGNEATEWDWTALDKIENGLDEGQNILSATLNTAALQAASGNQSFTYADIRDFGFQLYIRDGSQRKFFQEGDKAIVLIDYVLKRNGTTVDEGEENITISYHPNAALSYQVWMSDELIFNGYRMDGATYEFTFEVKKISSVKVGGGGNDGNGGGGGYTGGGGSTSSTPSTIIEEDAKVDNGTATVTADTAAVKAAVEAAGAAAVESGEPAVITFIVNLPDGVKPEDVAAVEQIIPAAAAQYILEAKVTVAIETPIATIALDTKAFETVSDAGDGDITISASIVDADDLTDKQKEQAGDRPVYDFTVTNGDTEVSHFKGGKAHIEIPYTLKTGENPNAIVVYYLDADGKLKQERGKYIDGKVVFTVTHFSFYVIQYNPIPFLDLAEVPLWAIDAVEFVAARNLIAGLEGDTFTSSTLVSRGEFTAMLMNYYVIELDPTVTDNFSDVGANAPYAAHLATAKKMGLVGGTGGNNYNPERIISRAEMFALLYNILEKLEELPAKVADGKKLSDFTDASEVNETLRARVEALLQAGIVTGATATTLNPRGETSRRQSSQLIFNLPI